MRRQQGEVKAINVSEPAMRHTAVLIDRWHQESVPFLFSALADMHIHPNRPHTHSAARTSKKHRKGGEGSYSRTTMSKKKKKTQQNFKPQLKEF